MAVRDLDKYHHRICSVISGFGASDSPHSDQAGDGGGGGSSGSGGDSDSGNSGQRAKRRKRGNGRGRRKDASGGCMHALDTGVVAAAADVRVRAWLCVLVCVCWGGEWVALVPRAVTCVPNGRALGDAQ